MKMSLNTDGELMDISFSLSEKLNISVSKEHIYIVRDDKPDYLDLITDDYVNIIIM